MRRLSPGSSIPRPCSASPARPGDRDPQEARKIVVEGLREIARVGVEVGVRVALEPIHSSARDDFTMIDNIPDAVDLLDEVGVPMGILFDTWHLWDTPDVLDHIRANAHRFPAVHVNDWRDPTRGWDDRVLPGDGLMDLPAIFGHLRREGSTAGSTWRSCSADTYPNSPLELDPVEFVRRGKAGFLKAWEARH